MILLYRLFREFLRGPLLHRLYKLIVLLTICPLLISSSINLNDGHNHPLLNSIQHSDEDSQYEVTRSVEPQVLSRLESHFLKLFGMERRPSRRRKGKPIKIPKYLVDLYNAQTGSEFPTSNLHLPGRHIRTANTVRTFYHLPDSEMRWGHGLKFDISSIPSTEEVTGSELRLMFNNDLHHSRYRGKVRVLIYDVIKPTQKRTSTNSTTTNSSKFPVETEVEVELEPPMYPMDVKLIDLKRFNESDWITFDIYPAVSRWLENPSENHGLVLKVHKLDGRPIPNAAEKHFRIKRSTQYSISESFEEDPVLFTYSDDGVNPKSGDAKALTRRYRRAANPNGGLGGGNGNGGGKGRKRKGHRNKNRRRNLCAKHKMFVDFADVGWNDWIVAPPGYHAYHCAGECPFPMADHLNATNHAVIQALVNSMNPQMVPPPCCVPTKYSSLSLLYTDPSEKIVLRNYQDMVVDSCGCS